LLVSSSSSESSVFPIRHPMSLTEKDEQTLGLVAKLRQKVYRDWWCKFYGFQKEVRFALNEDMCVPTWWVADFSQDARTTPIDICARCANKPEFYCPNCNQKLCIGCTGRIHHPGTYADRHSIEELIRDIDGEPAGIHIVTPILDYIMLLFVLGFLISKISITESYLESTDLCPSANHAKRFLAMTDTSLFYYYKANLVSYCNIEDSFWKLLCDLWVRSIVTDSDNMLLIITTLPQALVFFGLLKVFVVPVVGTIYGILKAVLYQLELWLSQIQYISPAVDSKLRKCARFERDLCKCMRDVDNNPVAWFTLDYYFFRSEAKQAPPLTRWRSRQNYDFMEGWWYFHSRQLRYFTHFHAETRDMLHYWLSLMLIATLTLRVLCIQFQLGGVLRNLTFPFVSASTVESHQLWFKDAAGMLSDQLMFQSARLAGQGATIMFPELSFNAALLILGPVVVIPFLMPDTFRRLLNNTAWQIALLGLMVAGAMPRVEMVATLATVFVAGYCGIVLLCIKQRRKFESEWVNKTSDFSRWSMTAPYMEKVQQDTLNAMQNIGGGSN